MRCGRTEQIFAGHDRTTAFPIRGLGILRRGSGQNTVTAPCHLRPGATRDINSTPHNQESRGCRRLSDDTPLAEQRDRSGPAIDPRRHGGVRAGGARNHQGDRTRCADPGHRDARNERRRISGPPHAPATDAGGDAGQRKSEQRCDGGKGDGPWRGRLHRKTAISHERNDGGPV